MSRFCQACGEPMENHKPHPMGHTMKPPQGLRSRVTSRPGISIKVCPIKVDHGEVHELPNGETVTVPIYRPDR